MNYIKRTFSILLLVCTTAFTASAQITDTLKKDLLTAPDTVPRLHSKAWTLVPPGAMIAYGVSSFVFHPIRRIDYYIHGRIERSDPNFNTKAESYFLFAPVIMVYGLNLFGDEGKNRFVDRTALLGLSGVFMGISTEGIKHFSHRLRPNGSDYLSFPSGHTAAAFMFAEFLAQEYSGKSPVYSIIGYGFATATGVFRMYNRDHWFSDVVAGAGFGIISTKLAYLTYPWIRGKLTHTDPKTGNKTMLVPTYQDGAPGLAFAMQFK